MIVSPEILHRNKAPRKSGTGVVKIVNVPLLGGWYVVRGKHHTPISGRFDSRQDAANYLSAKHKETV